MAEVIKRTFGIRYHRDHVGKLMREAGWSRQKPVERASQRNEEAIKQWSDERWPDIKKAEEEKATIVWADSTPAGETDAGSPDSAICGITLDGRLFMQVRLASYNAEAVVGFLRVLLRKMRGQDRSHLGWLAHPPGSRDQRLSQAWGCLTLISGATARLRARSQS